MPAATRKSIDPSAGHCFSPRAADEGSPDVITNGQPQVRVGDHYPTHSCGNSSHDGVAAAGSATVITNGRLTHRIGDAISCGDVSASGSPNVFVGDMSSLPEQYSVQATEKIREEAGRFAPLDEVETIAYTPSTFPPDKQPASTIPIVETVTPQTATTVSTVCLGQDVVISDSLQLTPNFTLGMLSTKTLFPHTVRDQAGFTLPDIVCNLKAVAENILEPLLAQFPGVRINCGFRTITNGKSQHEKGMAADVQWPSLSPSSYMPIAKWCANNLPIDQIIFEHGRSIWLHLSYNRIAQTQRGLVLTMHNGSYEPGLKLYYNS